MLQKILLFLIGFNKQIKNAFYIIMKATGIVRRIEARVIITQKSDKAL